jgi:electron-transferring-flavoprotein dehydrogenase
LFPSSFFLLPSSFFPFLLLIPLPDRRLNRPALPHSLHRRLPQLPAYNDLWAVRNVRPAFNTRLGVFGGVMHAAVDTMLRGGCRGLLGIIGVG